MTIVAGGTEILVSTTNADTQANQQITTLADGGFAVTWDRTTPAATGRFVAGCSRLMARRSTAAIS